MYYTDTSKEDGRPQSRNRAGWRRHQPRALSLASQRSLLFLPTYVGRKRLGNHGIAPAPQSWPQRVLQLSIWACMG